MPAYLVPIDLRKNELRNARIHNLPGAPANPVEGQVYFDTADSRLYVYDGSGWTFRATDSDLLDGQDIEYYRDRRNHTFTQPASTVHDFDEQVRTNRLDQLTVPEADSSVNGFRLTNVGDPVDAADAANKGYVDSVAQGLDVKEAVQAATTGNITLSGEQTIDGYAVTAGDRVLVRAQTAAAENGIYVVAAGAWTRADDASTTAELNAGSFTFVENGSTNGNTGWVVSEDPDTLGTDPVVFTQFSGAGAYLAGAGLTQSGVTFDVGEGEGIIVSPDEIAIDPALVPQKVTVTLDAPATSYTINHNLNNQDVHVQIRETSAPYSVVIADIELTDENNVLLRFAVAPTAGSMRVSIIG